MAKKTKKRVAVKKTKITWHYFVPSLVGAAIAAFFSGSLTIGLEVFIAVLVGTWVIKKYGKY